MKKYVDFYITHFPDFASCLPFCRQLTAKVFNAGNSCIIYTEQPSLAESLDQTLWDTDSQFIPHDREGNVVTVYHPQSDKLPIPIQLQPAKPLDDTLKWQRCLQIVPNQPDFLACARQQFKHYQQQGAVIKTHKIG